MRIKKISCLALVMLLAGGVCHADFKYTQSSKVTGGTLVSMTKALGVFSKSARQITDPQVSTMMVKGNRMRSEHATGQVEIIDLEGRRFISIDPAKKTYSTMTFDEFKANMQRAQERAKEEQEKAVAKHPEAANVKITPKMTAAETGATRAILDLPTKEVKWRIDMLVESTDPKVQKQAQSATMSMNSDSWIAPSVPGYDEMRQFYVRMSKELDWLPATMGNMAGMNPQMGPAVREFQKNMVNLNGMPLLQNVSFGMSATGVPQNQTSPNQTTQSQGTPAPAPPPQPAAQQESQDSGSVPTNAKEAISKSLGGVFGGFGKKKKQPDQAPTQLPQEQAAGSTSGAPGSTQPVTVSGSLMDMQIEVTSFSNNSLDKTLFDVPANYTQVQPDPDAPFGGRRQ